MATDVATSLPDLVLAPGSTITVTLDDAFATVTQLNVYGYSPTKRRIDPIKLQPALLTHEPLTTIGGAH